MDGLKKVLYISYDGLTDPLGQSQVLPYLQALAANGFQFTILSFEKKDRFEKEKDIVQKIVDKAGIKWIPLSFTSRPPVLSKIYDRYRMKKTAADLHRKEKFDMVHCRSYISSEAGLKLKRSKGVKFLFDMRGFWADERVDNGQWNISKPFYKRLYNVYKKKEKEFLTEADGIVSLTKAAKDYLLSNPEYKDLDIEVIPCCADLGHFDYHHVRPEQVKNLKAELNIPASSKVIIYLGSVGGWYMTKEMFSFFKALSNQYPEYVMLVLTKDSVEKVKTEASEAGIPADKIFVTYSNREKLPVFLAMATSSIFFIRNTFSKIASSPTKHAELMGMGIPVICNDIGDTGNIINATKSGMVVNDFSDASLRNAVSDFSEIETMDKEKIRNSANEYFDLQSGARKYLQLYKKILFKNH